MKTFCMVLAPCVCVTMALTGCAARSTRAVLEDAPTADLSRYQVATVVPFAIQPEKRGEIDRSVGVKFAEEIARRLRSDAGELFRDVRLSASPLGRSDELVVTGVIKTYRPGSRMARAMLIGVGSAGFEGELVVRHAPNGQILLQAPFDRLWAWGGLLGASRGIEEMFADTAAQAANTVARAKRAGADTRVPALVDGPSSARVDARLRVIRRSVVLEEPIGDSGTVATAVPGEVLEVLDQRAGWYLVRSPDHGPSSPWRTGWVSQHAVERLAK